MDPAVAALDIAKAGVILANMIESYLAGGAPPSNPEGAEHDDLQDRRSTSVAGSLHLHSSIDDGAGPLQESGEYNQRARPSSRLELEADPDPRPGSRPVGCADNQSRGLQDPGQRRGHEPIRAIFFLEASRLRDRTRTGIACSIVRHRRHARDRRGRLLRSTSHAGRARSLRQSCTSSARASTEARSTRRTKVSCTLLCRLALFSTTIKLRSTLTKKSRAPFERSSNYSSERAAPTPWCGASRN